jgi:integrase
LPSEKKKAELTVAELILAFWSHAEKYYSCADGTPSLELDSFRLSLKPLRHLYGHVKASEIGPLALKAVRQKMIEDDLSRKVINQRIGRIKRMFRWATENELVPPSLYHGLLAVRGLQKGRAGARETMPVKPAPREAVKKVLAHLLPPVAAMVQLQLLTGMRPGEVTIMRGTDLNKEGPVWLYEVPDHKNAWRGQQRTVPLGPKAQDILRPFLEGNDGGYLFSPKVAVKFRQKELRKKRKSKVQPSQKNRATKNPQVFPGDRYTTQSYYRAVARACETAKVSHWHPNQLRHLRATEVRAQFGLDVARALLGHRSPQITEVYAEVDLSKAADVMKRIG